MPIIGRPRQEEATDSNIIPACKDCTVRIMPESEVYVGKEPMSNGQLKRGVKLWMEIITHENERFKGYKLFPAYPVTENVDGKQPWWGTVQLYKYMRQCGLDYILKYVDESHPDYQSAAVDAPQLDCVSNPEKGYEKLVKFYLTGTLVDDTGKTFTSPNGGLVNKLVKVSIGSPTKNKETGIEDTGMVKPLTIGSKAAAEDSSHHNSSI